jgi:hypothetical protein
MTSEIFNPAEFLSRAAERTGFTRVKYEESQIPTNLSDILVIFFFGDCKATFILSSLLLKNYIKKIRRPRYVILCSHPGNSSLFPYAGVNEYWQLTDSVSASEIFKKADGFKNNSSSLSVYESNLLRYFPGEVINGSMFAIYYNNGLTQKFFDDYKEINYFLPSIPSPSLELAKKISKFNYSVFICPSPQIKIWRNGREEIASVSIHLWHTLINSLIAEGVFPVVWLSSSAYDVSSIFTDKCAYVTEANSLSVLSAMRASSCVLDICSGLSKFAIMARAPYLCADIRQRYFGTKEYELDDLCAVGIQKKYAFLFNNAIEIDWNYALIQVLIKLKQFLPTIDRNNLKSAVETDDILVYDNVRKRKTRKIGLNFIKVNNEKV